MEIVTYIISKLPEAYENVTKNLENKLDDNNDLLTIKSICGKLLGKYYQMNKWLETKNSREDKKPFK